MSSSNFIIYHIKSRTITPNAHADAYRQGVSAKRMGLPRCCPAFPDPRMAEEWFDGYDSVPALNKRFEMGGTLLGQEVTA